MLTGDKIQQMYDLGKVHIDPFDHKRINPNSYNLQIGPKILRVCPNYWCEEEGKWYLDPDTPPISDEVPWYYWPGSETKRYWLLQPGQLYLGSTVEEFGSTEYIPCIVGRSSYARNGLSFELSAGYGDLGFNRQWTLEITVVLPNTILYCDSICLQGFFHTPDGRIATTYSGKYANQDGVTPSRVYLEKE